MKKLFLLALFPLTAIAGPWDLMQPQLNDDGGTIINRLMIRPSSGTVDAVMVYTASDERPHLFPLSGCSIGSGSFSCSGGAIDASSIADGSVSNAEFQRLDGVSSNIQTQLNAKFASPSGTTSQYIRGDGSLASGPVTSVTAGAGLSGGTITTTGTISLPNTGTAGTYSLVTTDAQGRVTSGTVLSINDSPGRSLVTTTSSTGFQVSASQIADVCYEGTFSTTSTIGGPSAVSVFLETADTNSTTPGDWTTKAQQQNSQTITLAIALQSVDVEPWSLCRKIPAGKFVRIRQGGVTGTASASIGTQQEVLI